MLKKLAILGAGGHGKVVAEIAELTGWQVHFFDDDYLNIKHISDWPVLGDEEQLINNIKNFSDVFVAIGDNHIRFEKTIHLRSLGFNVVSLIHPNTTVSKYASIGSGSVVMAGAIVNPFVKVGISSIINTASSIDHDCIIGSGVHICPGANLAGEVSVGDLSWIGIGTAVKECIKIGIDVNVGAGAVVVNAVPDHTRVKGIPAR